MKILRIFSYVVLVLVFLNLYGYAVRYIHVGGKNLGVFTEPFKNFIKFPETVFAVFYEVKKPEVSIYVDTSFKAKNELTYNVYALGSVYENDQWELNLTNFRTDSLLFQWILGPDKYEKKGIREFTHLEPRNPILFKDTSLVVTGEETNNMYRLDKNSNIIWHNTDFEFHHSINLNADSNIWACGREFKSIDNRINKVMEFWENSIVLIDGKTGKTLFKKDLSQLLNDNGLNYLTHGIGNAVMPEKVDPYHLNDIEPVLEDGPYWKRNDIFLSLRHRSLIFLYRPSTNRIVRVLHGPFYNQHDIDILSPTTISIFNNNTSSLETSRQPAVKDVLIDTLDLCSFSEILIYNFTDSTFTPYLDHAMKNEGIYTRTQGFHTILANGDMFVESQNSGTIFILSEGGTVFKRYYDKPQNGLADRPHWIRIYEKLEL